MRPRQVQGKERALARRRPARADQDGKGAEFVTLQLRHVGVVAGGMFHSHVAETLGVSRRTIYRW